MTVRSSKLGGADAIRSEQVVAACSAAVERVRKVFHERREFGDGLSFGQK